MFTSFIETAGHVFRESWPWLPSGFCFAALVAHEAALHLRSAERRRQHPQGASEGKLDGWSIFFYGGLLFGIILTELLAVLDGDPFLASRAGPVMTGLSLVSTPSPISPYALTTRQQLIFFSHKERASKQLSPKLRYRAACDWLPAAVLSVAVIAQVPGQWTGPATSTTIAVCLALYSALTIFMLFTLPKNSEGDILDQWANRVSILRLVREEEAKRDSVAECFDQSQKT